MEIISLILTNPGMSEIDAKLLKKLSEEEANELALDELLFKTNATLGMPRDGERSDIHREKKWKWMCRGEQRWEGG